MRKWKWVSSVRNSYLRGELIFAIDILVSLAASMIALLGIKTLFKLSLFSSKYLLIYIITSIVASVLLFFATRTFRIIIRHFGVKDIIPFAESTLTKSLVLFMVLSIVGLYSQWTVLVVVFDFLISILLLLGVRVFMILGYGVINRKQQERYNKRQVLIYGTSDKSVAIIQRLQNSPHYHVRGFLEKTERKNKYVLERLPVYSFKGEKDIDLEKLIDKGIDAVLFARDVDVQAEKEGLLKYCTQHGIKALIVPTLDELTEGQPLLHPREVKVEDLLGREEIAISLQDIKDYFNGKVVMVTGAAGSIGSELVRQLATFRVKKLVLFDNGETPMHNLRLELEDKFKGLDFVPVIGSVRHPERLDFVFRTWHPQVVFHAAAYKHVPLMEENPCEAVLVNVLGSRNVADKCLEYGAEKMVMISTDKAVNPTNVMGCTKRIAEIYVQSLGLAIARNEQAGKTKFVTTRFGNVLGSNGSVIPRFREQIGNGGPVTVTHPDINRFFMTIPEACRLVMEAATKSPGNQICVFDMGEPMKIDTLARTMISLMGFTPDKDIKIAYTGLRPGEKLYEEVLANNENTYPAFHDKIRIAKVREYDYSDAVKAVKDLEQLAKRVETIDMVRLMKQMVPEFKSKNSKYEELDIK